MAATCSTSPTSSRVHPVNISDVRDMHALRSSSRAATTCSTWPGRPATSIRCTIRRQDLEINGTAQLSLLETCRKHAPGIRIVFASTRQIYGKPPDYLPVDEKHLLRPVDVNGINKMAGEWYHILYNNVYGLKRHGAAPDQHLRPAHAGQGCPPDIPGHLDPDGAGGHADRGLGRRAAARLHLCRRLRRGDAAGRRDPDDGGQRRSTWAATVS
jgi:hypothetical protein